jgi:hypothetical protein
VLLLEHARDVFVLVGEDADEFLVLRAESVEQGLIEDADQFVALLEVLRALRPQLVDVCLPQRELLLAVHDLADLEKLSAVDPE